MTSRDCTDFRSAKKCKKNTTNGIAETEANAGKLTRGERDGIDRDSSNNVGKRAARFEMSRRFYSCSPTIFSNLSYFPSARLVLRREVLWHLDGIGPTIACLTETTTRRHLPDIASARPGIVRERDKSDLADDPFV